MQITRGLVDYRRFSGGSACQHTYPNSAKVGAGIVTDCDWPLNVCYLRGIKEVYFLPQFQLMLEVNMQ